MLRFVNNKTINDKDFIKNEHKSRVWGLKATALIHCNGIDWSKGKPLKN